MWELDYKESWVLKNWCFWTVVLEKTLESPLDCKETQPKGDQSWVFIGRINAKAEAPVLWPPDVKKYLIGKDPDAGKDWRQEEKGMTEDHIVGWHHWLDGHEFEQAPRVGDGQGGLACCSPWGRKESDTTEQLNWAEAHSYQHFHRLLDSKKSTWCSFLSWHCIHLYLHTFFQSLSFFRECSSILHPSLLHIGHFLDHLEFELPRNLFKLPSLPLSTEEKGSIYLFFFSFAEWIWPLAMISVLLICDNWSKKKKRT